jgi:hypothetical protein
MLGVGLLFGLGGSGLLTPASGDGSAFDTGGGEGGFSEEDFSLSVLADYPEGEV